MKVIEFAAMVYNNWRLSNTSNIQIFRFISPEKSLADLIRMRRRQFRSKLDSS